MSLECSICERDIRGGHAKDCSRHDSRLCDCSHSRDQHDEEGCCQECDCQWFNPVKKLTS